MLFTILGEVGSPLENHMRIPDPAEENQSMYTRSVELTHGPQVNLGRGEN